MVVGALIHYQEFGYAVIQLNFRVLSVRSRCLDAGEEFLSSMSEGVPLALARFCRGTALSGLGIVVVADEPGVELRLR